MPYPAEGIIYKCPSCGGIFDFDGPPDFQIERVEKGLPGYWKYRHTFGLVENAPVISLGEGNTPLLWMDEDGSKVALKMEHLNPTGSYKDRGSAVLISQLIGRGAGQAVEDSSGNAGASFAAYAARGGLSARVYVPESASGPKLAQIKMCGADLIKIPGSRSEAARAVLKEADRGVPYASHAYLPFGLAGIATIAYELFDEFGNAPGTIITPVGHGGLLLGILRGFAGLFKAGLIQSHPHYVAVQAENCAPMDVAMKNGLNAMQEINESPTVAEGVRVRQPARVGTIIDETPSGHLQVVTISEDEILQAYHFLPKRGIHVEPTSALAWAAYEKNRQKLPEPIVLILTGSGLKSTIT